MGKDQEKVANLRTQYQKKWSELQASFNAVRPIANESKREYYLKLESRRLGIPVKEYKQLYEIYQQSQKQPNLIDIAISKVDLFWTASGLKWLWAVLGFEGKKLWDFIQLLLIPIILAYAAQAINSDRARQEALNKYFDELATSLKSNLKGIGIVDVSKLPTDKQAEASKKNDEIRRNSEELQVIARAKTLTTLRDLDQSRVVQLLVFLKEANLIEQKKPLIKLSGANLSGIDLSNVNLSSVNLTGVNLSNANLSGARLCNTDLTAANLNNTNLNKSKLTGAIFNKSQLRNAKLHNSFVIGATFYKSKVEGADFSNSLFNNNNNIDTDFSKAIGVKISEDVSRDNDKNQPKLSSNKIPIQESGCTPVFAGPGFDYRVTGFVPEDIFLQVYEGAIYNDGYEWQRIDGGWIPWEFFDLQD